MAWQGSLIAEPAGTSANPSSFRHLIGKIEEIHPHRAAIAIKQAPPADLFLDAPCVDVFSSRPELTRRFDRARDHESNAVDRYSGVRFVENFFIIGVADAPRAVLAHL